MSRRIVIRATLILAFTLQASVWMLGQVEFEGMMAQSARDDFRQSLVRVKFVYSRSGVMYDDEYISGVNVQEVAEYKGAILQWPGFVISYAGGFWLVKKDAEGIGVLVELSSGRRVPAKVVGVDQRIELVLLHSQKLSGPGLEIGPTLRVPKLHFASNRLGRWEITSPSMVSVRDRGWLPEWEIKAPHTILPRKRSQLQGSFVFDDQGDLVGIVTRGKRHSYSKSMAVYKVLPPEIVKGSIHQLMQERGSIRYGWLGVTPRPDSGHARVAKVYTRSPAQIAGVKAGDRILEVGGQSMESFDDLVYAIRWRGAGNPLTLKVERDGDVLDLSATLCERRDSSVWAIQIPEFWSEQETAPDKLRVYKTAMLPPLNLGLVVEVLTQGMADALKCPVRKGLLVKGIREGSPAQELGFRVGDVVTKVNGKTVSSISGLGEILEGAEQGRVVLHFCRNGKVLHREVTLQ